MHDYLVAPLPEGDDGGAAAPDAIDAFLRANNDSIILANHVVSAIDALVLARLQRASTAGLSARLGSGVEWDRGGRWTLLMRLSW